KYYISEEIGFKPKSRIEVSCRNHKSLQTTLKKLDITDMMLYNNLTNEDFLVPIFNHLLFRLIHFRKNRKPYTWLELAINKFESNYE
ncbi:MAG: hypothetical protein K2K25_02250, partial [Muribaculaceae bacterium]|nr:hypothetical protein [Muribaculaceae bacterium]